MRAGAEPPGRWSGVWPAGAARPRRPRTNGARARRAAVGIAARGGDQAGPDRARHGGARAVRRRTVEQFGGHVGLAVPDRVEGRVGQAEVGGQVHDGAHPGDQLGDQVLGLPVGQGQEHQVEPVELRRLGRSRSQRRDRRRPATGCGRPPTGRRWPPAVATTTSRSGWPAQSRRSSTPAYPDAPTTPTFMVARSCSAPCHSDLVPGRAGMQVYAFYRIVMR